MTKHTNRLLEPVQVTMSPEKQDVPFGSGEILAVRPTGTRKKKL